MQVGHSHRNQGKVRGGVDDKIRENFQSGGKGRENEPVFKFLRTLKVLTSHGLFPSADSLELRKNIVRQE